MNELISEDLTKWVVSISKLNSNTKLIIGASRIEVGLENLLIAFLGKSKTKRDELLEGDNPLSTFSSKIKIVDRLGLLVNNTVKAIDLMRKMRNRAAHSYKEIDLKSSPFKDQISELNKLIESKILYKKLLKATNNKLEGVNITSGDLKEQSYHLTLAMVTIVVEIDLIENSITEYKRPDINLNIAGTIEPYR